MFRRNTTMDNTKQLKHLLSRAGFGLRFEDLAQLGGTSAKHAVKGLLKDPEPSGPVNIVTENPDYSGIMKGDIAARKMFLHQQRQRSGNSRLDFCLVTGRSTRSECPSNAIQNNRLARSRIGGERISSRCSRAYSYRIGKRVVLAAIFHNESS